MIPRVLIDTAQVPGGAELRLIGHGRDHIIMLGRNELMSSRLSGSEKALASLACERLRGRPRPHLLVGGLGMGFTLAEALAGLPKDASVTVVELVPEVVKWAKGPLAHIIGGSLDDPRVDLRIGDVGDVIAQERARFDAILLDVDNGPDGLTHPDNDRLYHPDGLRAADMALRPGGILAIWSAYDDEAFTRRLRKTGFAVEEVPVRATGGRKGAHHKVWLATRP